MITRTAYHKLFESIARAVNSIRHTDAHPVYFTNPEAVDEKKLKPTDIYMIMDLLRYSFVNNDSDNIMERTTGGFWLLKPVSSKEDYKAQDAAVEACKSAGQDVFALMYKLRKDRIIKDFNPKEITGNDVGMSIANSFGVYYEFPISDSNNMAFTASKYDMTIVEAITLT